MYSVYVMTKKIYFKELIILIMWNYRRHDIITTQRRTTRHDKKVQIKGQIINWLAKEE